MGTGRDGTGGVETFLQRATSLENTFMIGQCWEKCFGIIEIMETGEEKTLLQCASLDCTLMIALVLGEMFRDNR